MHASLKNARVNACDAALQVQQDRRAAKISRRRRAKISPNSGKDKLVKTKQPRGLPINELVLVPHRLGNSDTESEHGK